MYKKGKGRLQKSDGISAVSILEGRSKDFLRQSGRASSVSVKRG
ncbi:hypothetical protein [Peribacillus frigoritolerans]